MTSIMWWNEKTEHNYHNNNFSTVIAEWFLTYWEGRWLPLTWAPNRIQSVFSFICPHLKKRECLLTAWLSGIPSFVHNIQRVRWRACEIEFLTFLPFHVISCRTTVEPALDQRQHRMPEAHPGEGTVSYCSPQRIPRLLQTSIFLQDDSETTRKWQAESFFERIAVTQMFFSFLLGAASRLHLLDFISLQKKMAQY